MDITDRLYVEIHPLQAGQIPHPHPVNDAHFDPALVYKVLGMYNASETSECYLILTNSQRQLWFIPQRHLLAFALIDSDELFLTKEQAMSLRRNVRRTNHSVPQIFPGEDRLAEDRFVDTNGHQGKDRIPQKHGS